MNTALHEKIWRGWHLTFCEIPAPLNRHLRHKVKKYLAWAGSLPFANAKAVTVAGFIHWFRRMKELGFFKDVEIIIEATSGNTGLVLVFMVLPDRKLGIKEVQLVVKDDVPLPKRTILSIGGATLISPEKGVNPIETARRLGGGGWQNGRLLANGNVLNFDQYGHPCGPEAHGDFTAAEILRGMREQFGCVPTDFTASVGSGGSFKGTAEGLQNALEGKLAANAVTLAPEQEAPGMRDTKGAGPPFVTLDWDPVATYRCEVWTRPSFLAALWISRLTGCPVGATTGAAFMGEDEATERAIIDRSIDLRRDSRGYAHSVIFGPDSCVSHTDRFDANLPIGKWNSEGLLPLPWDWNWRGDPVSISSAH